MEPKGKLPKTRFDNQLKESANRILDINQKKIDTIPQVCNKVYAMGKETGFNLGKLIKDVQGDRKRKSANGGNRREPKLKKIKKSRQIVVKTSNELCRKRQRRNATKKEKEIVKELRVLIEKDTANYNLRNAREQWKVQKDKIDKT